MHPHINFLVRRTAELGVKLLIKDGNHVVYQGQKVSGFFTPVPEPILAFHLQGPNAEGVMLHESQHMEQWHENCKAWRESWITDTIHSEDLVMLWEEKKIEFTPRQLKRMIRLSVNVELDCEKRTAKLIRRLNREHPDHKTDVREYVQKANSYVMFWHMVGKTRKWYSIGKRPYELPEVYSEFPGTFSLDYSRLPRKYERLFTEHCY